MITPQERKSLNKNDFISIISEHCGVTKADAARAIDFFTKGIEEVVAKGEDLTLVGFGSFYITENKAREGRNTGTGEVIKIAASKTPKFRAGSDLKKLVINKL